MDNTDVIETSFKNKGLNCAETTMRLLAEAYSDLPKDMQKMMTGFGGGMQRGLTCGAVTAAVAAIGMKTGRLEMEESREPSAKAVRAFLDRFEAEFGALTCDRLTEGFTSKSDEMYRHCGRFVAFSADLAIKIIQAY
jgi:C_GCAxxG_C_C family probable redox protein